MTSAKGEVYVVYQMGKVGSSSVCATLQAAQLPMLYKVHYLSDKGLARGRDRYAKLARRVPVPHEENSEEVRHLLRARPELQWKVISLVREPIARDVSAYVQMVDVLHPSLVSDDQPQIGRIARAVQAQFLAFDETRSYTCQWFDDELAPVFGVDVYAHPFDHDRGWLRIRLDKLDLLILRMEDLDVAGAAALSEFTGKPLELAHDSSRNPRKLQAAYVEPVYSEIVRQVRIPESVCRRVYASRYARHFYSPAELDRYVARWSADPGTRRAPQVTGGWPARVEQSTFRGLVCEGTDSDGRESQ